jgi:hypothetical protein
VDAFLPREKMMDKYGSYVRFYKNIRFIESERTDCGGSVKSDARETHEGRFSARQAPRLPRD